MADEPPRKKLSTNIVFFGSDDSYEKNTEVITISADSPEISVDDPNEDGLKIVHLSDECLVKIFRHLNLADLTSVAEANVRLAASAKQVFAQVHENHRLFIRSRGDVIQIPEWHPLVDRGRCTLTGQIMENMFKHFGKYLRRIKVLHTIIGFRGTPNFNLVKLIAEHCSETLIELECFGRTTFSIFHRIDKAFVRLEKLILSEILTVESPLKNFNKIFPNLRFLEFHNVFHVHQLVLDQQFPRLEHFGLYTFPYVKFDERHILYIQKIVAKNPQIKSLSVYDMKLIPDRLTLESMPNIERLEIGGKYIQNTPFQFGNLKSLKLIYSNENQANCIEWRSLPAQLERLEVVGFNVNEKLLNLVLQCPGLQSLAVMAFETFDLEHLQKIAEHLQHLKQVEFISKFKEDPKKPLAYLAALKCMKNCPQLKRAIVTIQLEKNESQYRINKWTYPKSNEFLQSYKGMLEKTLIFDWWRWSIKHEVRIIDYLKGWQSGPCFRVIFENPHAINHN